MFKIQYLILDEVKEKLKKYLDKNVEEKLYDVEAQISFKCNNHEIGFVDKDIPYSGEYILTWMERLNVCVIQISKKGYCAMNIPESADYWIEFMKIDNKVCIREIVTQDCINTYILQESVTNKEIKWSEEIEELEFYEEIVKTTKSLMNELYSINELFVSSESVREFIDVFKQAEMVVSKK